MSEEIKNEESKKKPPSLPIKSVQFNLFAQFVTNDMAEVSNTIEYWENIPKYFLNSKQQDKLRTPEGLAHPYSYHYTLRDNTGNILSYKVKIQPALIEQNDGSHKAFFPSKNEESIEEVLKKVFTDQQCGIHDPEKIESWVRFSYSIIRRGLYEVGSGLKYDQIKHGLEVMSKTLLTVYENGKAIYTGAILQDYCSVDRSKYLDDTNAQHVARLPVFISHAVNTLQYRQYNYKRFVECRAQLTRFIYKRLVNRFTHANYLNDYHFLYSDIKQASGLLQQKTERENRKKVISALKELKQERAIINYEVEDRKEGRKIVDVKYTVKPTMEFVSEQKSANKRNKNACVKLPCS